MSIEPQDTALMIYLKTKSLVYHAKVLELREAIEGWLAYIPNTFPHYTRHTVRHSDEIVRQISKLLFKDEDPSKSVLPLTAVEAYLIIAAAYLHDAGMVVSDREKFEILQTNEWKVWVSGSNAGAKRWNEIQALRTGNEPSDSSVRNYLADLEARFLIAEFIRRAHHVRARTVIEQHQAMLGRFAFDDLVLQRTIADVCVAHGLRTHELEDNERFPDRRDIRSEAVNVRLMAILLRLGDLLDMSADRACPLLLNAACPLPADSLAHWTQYQRVTHRLTAPDRIEITAECQNQNEHRVLQDWCQWIVDEVGAARTLLSRTKRHHEYELPIAGIEGNDKTILIRPASNATYFPSSWTFQLDQEAIFQRLIYDAYEGSHVFIRELIQNALDANRCQLYADLVTQSMTPPQYPTQVSEEIRLQYPVTISLKWVEVENALSQETENRQVLTVSDCGIGMDKEIIQRYFLQVGRSFYTTDEFRRRFRFVPTSRFGVGFLSTFAVSDLVSVDTFKPSSAANDGPIRLTLTGPRNYLLTELGSRRINGTDIKVLLREPLEVGRLTKLTETWCRRVEFPIVLNDLGVCSTIVAENREQFLYDVEDVTDETSRLTVRAFPLNRPGIEGELYVFARLTPDGEAWDKYSWLKYHYKDSHPAADVPDFPSPLQCLHGIAMEGRSYYGSSDGYSARVDYRGEGLSMTLAREGRNLNETDPLILSRWEEILLEHISSSPYSVGTDGWRYRQRLVDIFKLSAFWRALDGMIPVRINGEQCMFSLAAAEQLPAITFVFSEAAFNQRYRKQKTAPPVPILKGEMPILLNSQFLSENHCESLINPRQPTKIFWLDEDYVGVDWSLAASVPETFAETTLTKCFLLDLPSETSLGVDISWPGSKNSLILNNSHDLVQWLTRVNSACINGQYGLKSGQLRTLVNLVDHAFRFELGGHFEQLQQYLKLWTDLPDLPLDLNPPIDRLTRDMFKLRHW